MPQLSTRRLVHRGLALSLIAGATLLMTACDGGQVEPDVPPPTCDLSSRLDKAITSGTYTWPMKVTGKTACDVANFAWQEFLFLTSGDGGMRFTDWTSREALFGQPSPGPGVPADSTKLAKSNVPLVDQQGHLTHFSVYANEMESRRILDPACGLTDRTCLDSQITVTSSPQNPYVGTSTTRLPDQSGELKLSWKVSPCVSMDDTRPLCENVRSRYLLAEGSANGVTYVFQLVGFHVNRKLVETSRDWVWATFEHVDNAPDCNDLQPLTPSGEAWNYFSACPDGEDCFLNQFCGLCSESAGGDDGQSGVCGGQDPDVTSTPVDGGFKVCSPDPRKCAGLGACRPAYRTQTCRKHPIAQASPEAAVLNRHVQRRLQGSVMANYQLVGTLWTDPSDGTELGYSMLANTTMETHLQTVGCLVCHDSSNLRSPSDPEHPSVNGPLLDHSFIFYGLRGQPETAGCGEGVPAPVCQEL